MFGWWENNKKRTRKERIFSFRCRWKQLVMIETAFQNVFNLFDCWEKWKKRQGRKLLSILGLSTVSFHSFTLLLLPSSVFANFVLRSLYGFDCCWGQCWCLGLCFLASWLHFDFVSSVMLVWQENEGKNDRNGVESNENTKGWKTNN